MRLEKRMLKGLQHCANKVQINKCGHVGSHSTKMSESDDDILCAFGLRSPCSSSGISGTFILNQAVDGKSVIVRASSLYGMATF